MILTNVKIYKGATCLTLSTLEWNRPFCFGQAEQRCKIKTIYIKKTDYCLRESEKLGFHLVWRQKLQLCKFRPVFTQRDPWKVDKPCQAKQKCLIVSVCFKTCLHIVTSLRCLCSSIRTSVWDLVASRGRVATGLSVLGYWQCNWMRCYHGPCLQAACRWSATQPVLRKPWHSAFTK